MIERPLNKPGDAGPYQGYGHPARQVAYNLEYILKGLDAVYAYVLERLEKTDTHVTFDQSDVYPVWFCKTLKNWKMMVSTKLPDGMYYEVTYDGDKLATYLDAYKKFENVRVLDPRPTSAEDSFEETLTKMKQDDENLLKAAREGDLAKVEHWSVPRQN